MSSFATSLTILLLAMVLGSGESASFKRQSFKYETFNEANKTDFFFQDGVSDIAYGALQLTPDTSNGGFSAALSYNKAGRIMTLKPFQLYTDDQDQYASFNTTFVINIYTNDSETTGNGLAFIIAPNYSVPEDSYGRWLGLTNATTDGNPDNQILAVEFDTKMEQDQFGSDPDGNHVGLNFNSIRSNKTVSLSSYDITLSSNNTVAANYTVWVEYNGSNMVFDVYMVKDGEPKPSKPLLSEAIDLKKYVKDESFLGFSASTGDPETELNCVLKWSLDISSPVKEKDNKWLKIGLGVGVPLVLIVFVLLIFYVMKRRQRTKMDEPNDQFGKLKWLPGMPREFKFKELRKATNGFNEGLKLGEGGFGIVYKGVLCDDQEGDVGRSENIVAVKKFSRDSIKSKVDFLAELTIIHLLRHKNLVPLVDYTARIFVG